MAGERIELFKNGKVIQAHIPGYSLAQRTDAERAIIDSGFEPSGHNLSNYDVTGHDEHSMHFWHHETGIGYIVLTGRDCTEIAPLQAELLKHIDTADRNFALGLPLESDENTIAVIKTMRKPKRSM